VSRSDVVKILKEFKENRAEKYGILLMGIFGSVARDQATEKSDVDIFLKTKTPDPFNIVHIKEELEEKLHHHVDIVRLRNRMNPFLKNRIELEAVYV
jgi:predicted nucleotidyltransferase